MRSTLNINEGLLRKRQRSFKVVAFGRLITERFCRCSHDGARIWGVDVDHKAEASKFSKQGR